MIHDRQKTKALIAAVVSHVFWGFSFMASRTALDHAPVFQLVSHRFLLAFLAMNLLLLTRRFRLELKNKPWGMLLLLGLMEPVIYFIGETYGLLHSNTIFSGVMIAMIPIVATLAAGPILKERPTAGQLIFSFISVGGVIGIGLLSSDSGVLDIIGLIGLVVAVASAAGYSLISRSQSASFSPFERCYMMMALGAAVFTPLAFIQTKGSLGDYLAPFREPGYAAAVLYLVVFASVICFFLSGYSLTYLSVAEESVFSNLTTAVSVFAGAVLLHEPFSWVSLVMCLLILIGIWGVQKASPK